MRYVQKNEENTCAYLCFSVAFYNLMKNTFSKLLQMTFNDLVLAI